MGDHCAAQEPRLFSPRSTWEAENALGMFSLGCFSYLQDRALHVMLDV